MPAITSRHSTTMTHRRDRVRVARSAGSRVRESIACLSTLGRDIGTSGADANASLDVSAHGGREATGPQTGWQARKLILDRPGGLDPTAAQSLVEVQQCLKPRKPHL